MDPSWVINLAEPLHQDQTLYDRVTQPEQSRPMQGSISLLSNYTAINHLTN